MHRHPVITFRVRPSGRRAMLAGTRLDVSDVIAALHDHDGSGEAAARWLDLPAWKVEECVRYYIDHRDEVDAEIREKADRAAEELEAWRRRQEVLGA